MTDSRLNRMKASAILAEMISGTFPLAAGSLIGTIHLAPLPGSPGHRASIAEIEKRALADAAAWIDGGADALIVENFGDAPFHPRTVKPHTTALVAVIAREIGRRFPCPVGINVLRNDGFAALGAALAAGAAFIRVNVFTGAAVTDQGIIEGRAHDLLRYRSGIDAEIAIAADVHVKHASPLVPAEISRSACDAFYRGRADALIVTGPATGSGPAIEDLEAVRNAVPGAFLIAGSGLNPDNAQKVFRFADAAIVGTWCKANGEVSAPVDAKRVAALKEAIGKTG